MTTRDDDGEPSASKKKEPAAPSKGPAAPPKMAARIADVEPFQAPFEPPPGSLKPPEKPPVWRADGKKTGQLAAASAPLPKTVELELPEAAPAIPATRELDVPSGASALFSETTYILNEAQLRGEQPAPLRPEDGIPDDEERTDRFTIPADLLTVSSDVDTVGDSPSPLYEDDDPTGPQSVLSFYEETTAILKGRAVPPDDDEEES